MTATKHTTGTGPDSGGDYLVMGGVSFEFSGLDLELDERTAAFTMRSDTPQPVHVRCRVRAAERRESRVEGRQIDVSWGVDELRVETAGATSRFRRTNVGYDVDTRADIDGRRASELLPSLVAGVVRDSGGLLIHAAGIELEGRGFLFIGPSGAGKSTAAALTRGGSVLTWDRAAISWVGSQPIAWAMPGGSVQSQAAGVRSRVSVPLAGVYRVRQAAQDCRVELLPAAEAIASIRESVFSPHGDVVGESATLDAVMRLCAAISTGLVHTVLGEDLASVLRAGVLDPKGVAA